MPINPNHLFTRKITTFLLATSVIFTLITGNSLPAAAQDSYLSSLKPGQSVLNISAEQHQEVTHDLFLAELEFTLYTHDQNDAQDQLNKAISKGLDYLRKQGNAIEFSTAPRQIHPYSPSKNEARNQALTDDKGRPLRWRASQSITLESYDFDKATQIIGAMQNQGFLAQGISTALSPKKSAMIQDNMMEDALAKLQIRADRATKALKKTKSHFVEINVNPGYIAQPRLQRSAVASSVMSLEASPISAPDIAAGKTTVTLNISAKVVLE